MAVTSLEEVWIELIPKREAFCDLWGTKRHESRLGSEPKNRAPTDLATALRYHLLGIRGEAALMLYFNQTGERVTWHYFVESGITGLPDIEPDIDVKTVSMNSWDLPVQKAERKDWIYVLARGELAPRICLVGWCWGTEAKLEEHWRDPFGKDRPAYFVKPSAPCFKPMAALREMWAWNARHLF